MNVYEAFKSVIFVFDPTLMRVIELSFFSPPTDAEKFSLGDAISFCSLTIIKSPPIGV